MTHEHSLIFIGGDAPHRSALSHLPHNPYVIAADSGYQHALASGLAPHVLIGDMDSISRHDLADAHSRKINIIEHLALKDYTDTELALSHAHLRNSSSVTIVSGGGDRFDHVLTMMHAVAFYAAHIPTRAYVGPACIDFFTGPSAPHIQTNPGDIVSLIPLGGNVLLSTSGLHWDLQNETLQAFASRGVSNIATTNEVSLKITHGVIAVIQPHFFTNGATP